MVCLKCGFNVCVRVVFCDSECSINASADGECKSAGVGVRKFSTRGLKDTVSVVDPFVLVVDLALSLHEFFSLSVRKHL